MAMDTQWTPNLLAHNESPRFYRRSLRDEYCYTGHVPILYNVTQEDKGTPDSSKVPQVSVCPLPCEFCKAPDARPSIKVNQGRKTNIKNPSAVCNHQNAADLGWGNMVKEIAVAAPAKRSDRGTGTG